ncbi:hypothetical protein [Desulfitobacterium sp. PCE1]|uniref:hypothetical protein n=1 Tax=Desulfitobacterium sp. PCE1 TaxID=146907 RepID=UPI00037A3FA0|nr:hypothetical protein [Desulfitobacterium sp. PCE1]
MNLGTKATGAIDGGGRNVSEWLRDDSEKLNIVATYNLLFKAVVSLVTDQVVDITVSRNSQLLEEE